MTDYPHAFRLLDALAEAVPAAPELDALRARLTTEYQHRLEQLRTEAADLGRPARRRIPVTPERVAEAQRLHDELGHVDLVARALGISRAQTYRLLAEAKRS